MSATESNKPNPLAFIAAYVNSSVGAKTLVALSGFLLWGFVLQHVVMNLQVFIPAGVDVYWGESINNYAHKLKSLGALLWVARIGLIVIFVGHILISMRLARLNAAARPIAYDGQRHRKSTFASRTMKFSGPLLLAFLLFHIAHFTLGVVQPDSFVKQDGEGLHHVAQMMWDGFSVLWIVVIYVVGNIVVVTHLFHGSQSLWQSIGFRHPVWTPVLTMSGRVFVFGILAGNLAMPLVLFYWHIVSAG